MMQLEYRSIGVPDGREFHDLRASRPRLRTCLGYTETEVDAQATRAIFIDSVAGPTPISNRTYLRTCS